jgi:hypothetical protein
MRLQQKLARWFELPFIYYNWQVQSREAGGPFRFFKNVPPEKALSSGNVIGG